MRVTLSPIGAGVTDLTLARHVISIARDAPRENLQSEQRHQIIAGDRTDESLLIPMALLGVTIDGTFVPLAANLTATGQSQWRVEPDAPAGSVTLAADVTTADGLPVATVRRTYTLSDGQYRFGLRQSVQNLTERPLSVQWAQLGPTDLPKGKLTYGGDLRRLRKGQLASPAEDSSGSAVFGREFVPHASVVGTPGIVDGVWRLPQSGPDVTFWPPAKGDLGRTLSWVGYANRYFAVVMHAKDPGHATGASNPAALGLRLPLLHAGVQTPAGPGFSVGTLDRVALQRGGAKEADVIDRAVTAVRTTSPTVGLAPGARADFSVEVYAGPISKSILKADPLAAKVGLTDLEMYTFGGPCAFCTFQPVAYFLRWFLSLLHALTADWALAIILLVLCVRTLLHPVTRWSQMSINRFTKQMQKLAPKQKALQEKYAGDSAKLREELAKLMKEENVSYAGMLGCIPMFLQMPVWIALYAMIFFFFDLRHEPAFYGLFQAVSGGSWSFLADLAEPDRFVWSPGWAGFEVPLMGHVDSINILPLILGLVFFVQQKYLTPPTTGPISPEMELQQKIMKVMIVVLFPLMMYNAPSGLALYFITNSTLGIIESRHIRKRFDQLEAAREEELKRNPHLATEKVGLMARLQQRALDAQKRAENIRNQQMRQRGGR
jgi:YidC/Oxa1 family membrane protein insertase